jgi:hypothetical protein
MMNKLFCLLLVLYSNSINLAQNNSIEIPNYGFEIYNSQNAPVHWNFVSRLNPIIDKSFFHSGKTSLLISHDEWEKSCITSDEVSLQVGHIYKLSAWAKSEAAFSNSYDQYPTPVAGCITMESFPFTNNSPAIGATKDWYQVEVMFVATKSKDRIQLHLGYNGKAKGNIWFDDIELEEVTDISKFIPLETVKWYGPAFRYEDKGWIFVHIEGKPYQRGVQLGSLLSEEIKMFIEKLSINYGGSDPQKGWNTMRFETDAMFLRKYDAEYLEEMKGIADGAAKNGAKVYDRVIDLLDIVTINSSIDLDYVHDAMNITPNPLTGKSFLADEDELNLKERLHKCSSFLANNSATKDKGIVFGQLFMWNGYTGYHWNVFVDVIPSEGNRLVYETFPGGIHSGADFYINSAGIMMGETTVQQTPYNPDGIPQSNRIRKAAQYANNIDDVVRIMTTKNNGMYTNDWLIGDVKKNEIAILLLGTNKWKLWRSSNNEWYNDAKDFYWSDNNNKDLEVRKEYIQNSDEAPADIIFRPVNRDITFWNFYQQNKGSIDQDAAVNLLSSSPINRPHACDGKVTTSEMASQLMFMAHSGKVTLREQMIGENGRMPDLPNAYPRLTLGYWISSPVYIAEKLKELKNKKIVGNAVIDQVNSFSDVKEIYSFDKKNLWKGTVYPASEKENWFVSATAGYYNLLKQTPSNPEAAFNYSRDEFSELNYRLLYVASKEGLISPSGAKTIYDKYNNYQVPRIKGTYLLHQLRLLMGNKSFADMMNEIHANFRERNITTDQFIIYAEKFSGQQLKEYILQWLNREDIPYPTISASTGKESDGWKIKLAVKQSTHTYHFFTTIAIETDKERIIKLIEINQPEQIIELSLKDKPLKLFFNYGNDIPVDRKNYFTYSNLFDDFSSALIVYGTKQQIEANHTIALRYQKMIADRFTEILLPLRKDSEVEENELASKDLIILGGFSENSLAKRILENQEIECGKYFFKWSDITYSSSNDGLYVTFPNPFNPLKAVYLFHGNSAQQLYQMTKRHQSMPAWVLFKGDKIVTKGYHSVPEFELSLN